NSQFCFFTCTTCCRKEIMHTVVCPYCKDRHDIRNCEPTHLRPDAFLRIPEAERETRTRATKDLCVIRSPNGLKCRYFVRVLMPFRVIKNARPFCWSVWVEVLAKHFEKICELWDDPQQSKEPPFPGRIANKIPGYDNTLKIRGLVSLKDPRSVPR